ncbi:hypothetical protein D8676_26465 [Mesorhizobium sp. YM1C-6-2]|nr:hypothetical protein D8676_26465 [Mesorhizobium sp. YM1C-6-2]
MEKADRDRGEGRTRVTFAGKTSTRTSFDPKKFALLLLEKRIKKTKTIEERDAWMREAEAKVGRH